MISPRPHVRSARTKQSVVMAVSLTALVLSGCAGAQSTSSERSTARPSVESNAIPSNVPLPEDLAVVQPDPAIGLAAQRWLGTWVGKWDGKLDHVLVIEQVLSPTEATVVYAVGKYEPWDIPGTWSRKSGTISGETLTLTDFERGSKAEYTIEGETLSAIFHGNRLSPIATMQRAATR